MKQKTVENQLNQNPKKKPGRKKPAQTRKKNRTKKTKNHLQPR
jgi:hypothetical protein